MYLYLVYSISIEAYDVRRQQLFSLNGNIKLQKKNV